MLSDAEDQRPILAGICMISGRVSIAIAAVESWGLIDFRTHPAILNNPRSAIENLFSLPYCGPKTICRIMGSPSSW